MKLASAQIKSNQNNVEKNLNVHYRFITIASEHGADLITFPEMSITGYLRERADYNMVIIAGAPIQIESNLFIGSFIIKPDSSISIYTKQYLHTGEEEFFNASFNYNPIIDLANERISLARCADIENPLHPDDAAKNKSTIYVSSSFSHQKVSLVLMIY